MTKEERKQSRAICDAATSGPWKIDKKGRYEDHDECYVQLADDDMAINDFIVEGCRYENADFIAHARTALPAALDALDKMDAQIALALKSCPNCGNDGYITPRPCQCEMESDRWKARAEALERAMLGDCTYCTHMTCKMPCACIRGSGWQFDESRFATTKEDAQA